MDKMNYKMVHTCIRVMDLEKSIDFYGKALGFKEVNRIDREGDFTIVYLEDGVTSYQLELTYNYGKTEPYTIGDGYSHMAVIVDDLEKSHQLHKEMGFEVTDLKGLPGEEPRFYFI